MEDITDFTSSEKSIIAGSLRCYVGKEDLPDGLKLASELILDRIKRDLKRMNK